MVETLAVLGGIAAVFMVMHAWSIRKYLETKEKSNLYFGITCLLWVVAAVFGILIGPATTAGYSSLALLFYRASTTSGILGYVFANLFAVAATKPDGKMRGIWIPLATFVVITSIVWGFTPMSQEFGGTTEFTLPSTYKDPFGPPLIETTIALMAVMAMYPISLFFNVARSTKESSSKMKSLLMGIGLCIGTMSYAVEITDAIAYQYMMIYRSMIFVGSFIMFLGQFIYPAKPSIPTKPQAFSKTLGLDHTQMTGRKVLFEFDPASNYEKPIKDFATEALANTEQTIVFTRKGGAVHSSLSEYKNAKFFCLTQQLSIPKEVSENEILLPSTDISLILGVLDKTLKAYPHSIVNVVFDNLSDLVLSIGFDKTYRFIKYALEILASPKTTVLFLLNQSAHDPQVTSNLRSLFSNQIFFGKEGMQTVKLSKTEIAMIEMETIPVKGE